MNKSTDNTRMFVISGEMIAGRGEDTYIALEKNGFAAFGVFDGCGGLGARKYPSDKNHSGAYIAARLAAKIALECFDDIDHSSENDPKNFGDMLEKGFAGKKAALEAADGASRVRSDMVRTLPTTACVSVLSDTSCRIEWLGDSRVYSLDEKGLHRLTSDDGIFRQKEELYSERRLRGYVNADESFTLNQRTLEGVKPVLWIAATDGFYGSFRTPMELEDMLLTTLFDSDSIDSWKSAMCTILEDTAADDYTAVFCFDAHTDYTSACEKLKDRHESLAQKLKPLYEAGSAAAFDSAAEKLWKEYRSDYLGK